MCEKLLLRRVTEYNRRVKEREEMEGVIVCHGTHKQLFLFFTALVDTFLLFAYALHVLLICSACSISAWVLLLQ